MTAEDIIVVKKDEVHVKVYCEPSIAQELNDYFSFDVPGAKFHPLYKSRMWDGKVRLFSMFTKEIYAGLKDYVETFAKEREYSYKDAVTPVFKDPVTYEDIEQFCKELNLASRGQPIEIREYQIEAVYRAIADGRRLLLSPTGSGKSLIIYCLIRWHEKFGRRQVILVPTTSLVEQMYSDFQDYSSINGWKASNHCHRIYGGHEKSNEFDVVISTWQSLYKLPKSFFEGFQTIYGDEAHLFKAKSLTSILNKCTGSPYRIGTTGTLDGTKTHRLVLEGIFGPVLKVTTTKQLISDKTLADLKIFNIEPERKVFFVYGGTDAEQREEIRGLTEKEKNAIIVASYGTFSTGINIKNLHSIIFASPSKSRIRNLQSIGRGLRTSENKEACTLYDIGDDLTWKTKKNYTLLHMIERIKIYNDEHFNYKIIKVSL